MVDVIEELTAILRRGDDKVDLWMRRGENEMYRCRKVYKCRFKNANCLAGNIG
jgi:hypothetical protein